MEQATVLTKASPGQPLPRILKSIVGNVAAIGSIAGAWGYLAGYVYLRDFLDNFGLDFGITDRSTAEVIILGYYSTLYAIWSGAFWLAAVVVVEFALVTAAVAFVLYGARRNWRFFSRVIEAAERSEDRISRGMSYFLAASLIFISVIGTAPAGALAAKYDIGIFARRADMGCCKTYEIEGRRVAATILAADTSTTWLLTRGSVLPVETKLLRVIAPARTPTKMQKHYLPWQPGN